MRDLTSATPPLLPAAAAFSQPVQPFRGERHETTSHTHPAQLKGPREAKLDLGARTVWVQQ